MCGYLDLMLPSVFVLPRKPSYPAYQPFVAKVLLGPYSQRPDFKKTRCQLNRISV